jgi:hypothetical protein
MSPLRDFTQPAVRRAWIRRVLGPIDEAKWNELARELFAWQFVRVPAYRRLCLAHRITPQRLESWRDIPAVPQQLFKREKLYGHGTARPAAVYETSGTTTGQPGRQHLLRIDIYRTISVEGARRAGLLKNPAASNGVFEVAAAVPAAVRRSESDGYQLHAAISTPQLHFLTPSPHEAPHSSLSTMFGFWQKATRQTGPCFWMRRDKFEFASLRETLIAQIKIRCPIAICGTAFSFAHLIDAWSGLPPLRLPRGSWLLETGGFKGRSREISKTELYAQLSRLFSIPDNSIWNEYGMSELSSQAYARGTSGLHEVPPWTRVLVCDPTTGREVRIGQRGLIRWIDLANVDSVMALQTLDVAERMPHGFRLIGRLPRTEPRGCSLSAEDLKEPNLKISKDDL